MNTERPNQTQTQKGAQQSQSQRKPDPRARVIAPDEVPGTLTDEDCLEATDPHPDSRPDSRRDQVVDPERSGGAEERSQSI
jgi:hypothetical protein